MKWLGKKSFKPSYWYKKLDTIQIKYLKAGATGEEDALLSPIKSYLY